MPEETALAVPAAEPSTGQLKWMAGLPIDRVLLRTKKLANGCIVWVGGVHEFGHGRIQLKSGLGYCHRVVFEHVNGPIPDRLCVLHNCPAGDNPRCVNPRHLWLGTRAENNADRDKKGRRTPARGELHGCAKLTADQVQEIARKVRGGRSCRSVAKDYGVNPSTIMRIINGKNWSHLKGKS